MFEGQNATDDRSDPEAIVSHEVGSGTDPDRVVRLIAIVKPFRAPDVLKALESIEVIQGTVHEVMGFGRQKNRLPFYLGSEFNDAFLPKVQIVLTIRARELTAALRAIVGSARTGRMGDGKVLVVPCEPAGDEAPGGSIATHDSAHRST